MGAGRQISLAMVDSPSTFPAMSFAGTNLLEPTDAFVRRHIGPSPEEQRQMLAALGVSSLAELTEAAVPLNLRLRQPLQLPPPLTEPGALAALKALAHNLAPEALARLEGYTRSKRGWMKDAALGALEYRRRLGQHIEGSDERKSD